MVPAGRLPARQFLGGGIFSACLARRPRQALLTQGKSFVEIKTFLAKASTILVAVRIDLSASPLDVGLNMYTAASSHFLVHSAALYSASPGPKSNSLMTSPSARLQNRSIIRISRAIPGENWWRSGS